jgi:hypothetical protein
MSYKKDTNSSIHQSTKNLLGQRFGKLIVKEFYGYKHVGSKDRAAFWVCKCDCGNTSCSRGAFLLRGSTKSCGCSNKEHMERLKRRRTRKEGSSASRLAYCNYRYRSKKNNIDFQLTYEEAMKLFTSNCNYCDGPPMQISGKWGGYNGTFLHSGIDRIDSSLGYTVENSVPCCWWCNRAKNSSSIEEFKEWATRLYKHMIEGKN